MNRVLDSKSSNVFSRLIPVGILAVSMMLTACGTGNSLNRNQENVHAGDESLLESNEQGQPTPVIQIQVSDMGENSEASNGTVHNDGTGGQDEVDSENNLVWDGEESMNSGFYISKITDEIFARMQGKSFKEDCTLPREDLRYLHVLHKNLQGETLEGELVVNVHIADTVLDIMKKLYEADYPIEKIRLVDEYDADDERSMADNNSSAFNFRFVSHTTKISKHGYGLAIDINPLYNPYITTRNGEMNVEPANGMPYVDRSGDYPYKIDENDLAYLTFREAGFEWGGAWKNSKDYQHFEIPADVIQSWYPN